MRNLLASAQTVTVALEYPRPFSGSGPAPAALELVAAQDGKHSPATVQSPLAPITVPPYSTQDISLAALVNELPDNLPFGSVHIQFSGPPGSLQAEVTSVEAGGNLVIDSHIQNEGNGWAGSGANPWHLDDDTETILFLTNESDETAHFGFKVTADGSTPYYLTKLQLNPHETRAIDMRKLRDAQQPDFNKSTVPATATDGSVIWIRGDNLPVMGRMMQIHRRQGMASNYDCCFCGCPYNYAPSLNYLSPQTLSLLVNGIGSFVFYAGFRDCNQSPYWYNYSTLATWYSGNPSIALLQSNGTFKGVSGGSTSASAYYTGNTYTFNGSQCSAFPLPGGANGTINVCTLSISTPTTGAVYNLGGSNYNQATVPLNASSASSGTANWTLNYTYTSRQPATYTGSSSTSSTIGQTSNYATPVGEGGQVTAQASATLGGQNFNSSVTFYVLGTSIPNATISSRLLSLYSNGATPSLLKGVACYESSYQQFVQRYLMGGTGLWPNGNNSGTQDVYVGLMQVPNGMAPGFDWYTNTSNGLSTFQGKYTTVQGYVSGLRSQHSGLPDLSGSQYEDNQLMLYGGWWVNNSSYYWVPNSTYTGWVVNTSSPGYNYVNTVRNDISVCG